MKQQQYCGTYVGHDSSLLNKTALLLLDPAANTLLAQFDDMTLYRDDGTCLAFGWHEFATSDFLLRLSVMQLCLALCKSAAGTKPGDEMWGPEDEQALEFAEEYLRIQNQRES